MLNEDKPFKCLKAEEGWSDLPLKMKRASLLLFIINHV